MHLKVWRRLALAVLLSIFATALIQPSQSLAETLEWKFTSNHKRNAQIAFYSRTHGNRVWPGGGKAYDLNDYAQHTYRLECIKGEIICFGAWETNNAEKIYWGVGFRGKKHGCKSCCYTCGQNTRPLVLDPLVRFDD